MSTSSLTQIIIPPSPNHAPIPAAGSLLAIPEQLRAFFGSASGWLVLVYGQAPAGAARIYNKKRYFQYPAHVDQAATYALQRAAEGYDVGYVVNLVTRKPRYLEGERLDAGFILRYGVPAASIYADDLRPGCALPPSQIIQTSAPAPGKYPQAFLTLDRPLAPQERADLSRRWAALGGADKSGHDVTQVLRLADTQNYKRAKPHMVSCRKAGQQTAVVPASTPSTRCTCASKLGRASSQ